MVNALPQNQFDNVVRWIKCCDADRAAQLAKLLGAAVSRLGRYARRGTAVAGVPAGSDHYDSGSLGEWLAKVSRDDQEAVLQVADLHATIKARLS